MKNKKKILSLIACLSLLSSCNSDRNGNRYCLISTTPDISNSTPDPIPNKSVEELNKELFENYINTSKENDGTLCLLNFKDEIPEEYLNLETIIIPESINDVNLTIINNVIDGTFSRFIEVKTIKIPSTISIIKVSLNKENSSPFVNLPNLENIEVDANNEYYYSKGNCLIKNSNNTIICGWKNVEIPDEITTTVRDYAFSNNKSISTIKLHPNVSISSYSFKYIDNLTGVDLNGKTGFTLDGNTIYNDGSTIYAAWGNVTISSSVPVVSLDGYSSVTSVLLKDGVYNLREYAFRGTKIKSLKIPASVSKMNATTFDGLTDIENIEIDANNKYFEVNGNCILSLSSSSPSIYYAYGDAVIPDYKNTLASNALQSCYSLKSLTFHNKFVAIDKNCFSLLPDTDKFTTIKFKGTIAEFKEIKRSASLYDVLKDRTTLNVEFLETIDGVNWTVKDTYKMSELENIN